MDERVHPSAAVNQVVDVGAVLDQGGLGRFQIQVISLCAAVAVLDGFDTQAIGIAAPSIIKALDLGAGAIAPVLSTALVGATIGALAIGHAADRFGRRPMLIGAVLLFAAFTLGTAEARSLPMLLAARFLAGVGLGGATPCFISLAAEYAPSRARDIAVPLMWSAFPLGGLIGGFINPILIESAGWRSVFYLGAAAPLLLAVALTLLLPESLRFLAMAGAPVERIRRIVRRISPPAADAAAYSASQSRVSKTGGVRALFAERRGPLTLLLWIVFFCTFLLLVFVPLLAVPLLDRANGLGLRQTALIVMAYNLGSALGNAVVGPVIGRFGPIVVLIVCFVFGAMAIAGIGWSGVDLAVGVASGLAGGLCLGAGSAGGISLAASLYPTHVRSTGVGWAMAMGRLGQVAGPLIAGVLLARSIGARPAFGLIALFALASLIATLAMAGVRRSRS